MSHTPLIGIALITGALTLAGCSAPTAQPTISLDPPQATPVAPVSTVQSTAPVNPNPPPAPKESGPPLATVPVNVKVTGQQCRNGQCGQLTVSSVAFPEYKEFSGFIDLSLSTMASIDSNTVPPYRGIQSLTEYFKETASPRSETVLQANVLRNSPTIVVIALKSYIYIGGANGLSSTQYLNWLPNFNRLAGLQTMLLPDRMPAFIQALQTQHDLWLDKQRDALGNVEQFKAQWPFKPSDNIALLSDGVQVTFEPYSIAPKSFGEPSLTIPYDQLIGIFRPEYILIGLGLKS